MLFYQCNNFTTKPKTDSTKTDKNAPEIFTSGFIDVMNNGQVNASARFIRLSIGEPGKSNTDKAFRQIPV